MLKDILYGVNIVAVNGSTDVLVERLTFDSREAKAGSLFFAIRGAKVDGHAFIPQVIEQGCTLIICDEEVEAQEGVTVVRVEKSSRARALCE